MVIKRNRSVVSLPQEMVLKFLQFDDKENSASESDHSSSSDSPVYELRKTDHDYSDKESKATHYFVRKMRTFSFGKCISYAIGTLLFLSMVSNTILFTQPRPVQLAYPLKNEQMYTIVVNTFRRPDMLAKFIKHYQTCPRAESIRVVWSDQQNYPPVPESDPQLFSRFKKVVYQIQETDSLNNRFRPIDDLKTNAVFHVDDDIKVPCSDLDFAFEVWQNSPKSMVGFMPRTHTPIFVDSVLQYTYNCWWKVWWDGSYSMILTKAAFLHKDYMDLYTNHMPQGIKKFVDAGKNCEDIAMSFMVANETNLPPIYVRGSLQDHGVFNGISTSKSWTSGGHMVERNGCLNKLVEFYDGKMPLVKGHAISAPASSWMINQPATWLEYFSTDILAKPGKKPDLVHTEESSQMRGTSLSVLGMIGLLFLTACATV
mmetsp:Transcript_24078/g.36118  ORF Transcript_24078/g.36118 Transcript_24078/m.36118 type:complete len:428 (-) Transcript_24078:101-1384(-)